MANKKLNNKEVTANEELITVDISKQEEAVVTEAPEVTEVEVVTEEAPKQKPSGLMFAADDNQSLNTAANQLSYTARLTNIAQQNATTILNTMNEHADDFEGRFAASQLSHDAMDDLIADIIDVSGIDVDFLKSVTDEEIDKMIRSQQSKRSRSKNKKMTQENYRAMLVGAIAENLLRFSANKPKASGGGAVMRDIGFSDEDIEKLAETPDDLKREIRNVQSKKSIMKSKSDFDPQSVRWLQLMRAEQQLKEVRNRISGKASQQAQEALQVKSNLEELVAELNTEDLSPEASKSLLDKIKETLASSM